MGIWVPQTQPHPNVKASLPGDLGYILLSLHHALRALLSLFQIEMEFNTFA